ncbi:MAG: cell wall metabolism sensor histidine kinase WalK [Chloroflexi bacterium]|nr:cell wall metabolism sensor histidine kinase WalK [Chloroflexota bacterium]
MFRSIRWRIAVPYILLILLAMGGLTAYLSHFVREAHLADLRTQLTAEAGLAGDNLAPLLARQPSSAPFDTIAKKWARLLDARVTIIAPDGTVLGESHQDRSKMDNHLSRPEVQQALAEGSGTSIRYSHTVRYNMMYAAVPVMSANKVVGIVRIALPLRQIETNVAYLQRTILTTTVFATLLAMLLAWIIAGRTTRPVRELTAVAERMAAGDLDARLLPSGHDEVGQLTEAFQRMADQIRHYVTSLAQEQGRLAAVLDNMADGVLITGPDGTVRLINPAAARMFGTSAQEAQQQSFAAVVRHHRIISLWQACREAGREQVAEVQKDWPKRHLRVVISPLPQAESSGYLVILQDLTQLRRLEVVRRDFLSNISHELRTPLSSLKALVDTLRDGALDDPPAAQRFLDRVETEVDALTQMVQELVELTRIESGQVPLQSRPTPVTELLRIPLARLQAQAERAHVQLELILDPAENLPAVLADAERVHQVVTNLVHNAIKFTPPGGGVTVSAEQAGDEVIIAVRDTGAGIPADDLPRIFERFYRADRSRSGGGTGLGLSIAKHIVQAHGGRIWAESIEGRGSTFYFSLPVAQG